MASNDGLSAAPVLSTPAEHLLEQVQDAETLLTEAQQLPRRTDNELRDVYEVPRTAREIRGGQRRHVALQFPDSMLGDAPRVAELLATELSACKSHEKEENGGADRGADSTAERIYILADTSYSACCVDEIAAEHVGADVVVHYGRACLSPTSRLPVIHVFTRHQLDEEQVADAFRNLFPHEDAKVVLMADLTFQDHVAPLFARLRGCGYRNLLSTDVVHDPLGQMPNRSILGSDGEEVPNLDLKDYAVFHVSTPPTALLLALSSRVKSLHVQPTPSAGVRGTAVVARSAAPSSRALLGRRYAKVLSLASAGVIGVLVNTLSVANYLSSVDKIRAKIAAAGKKSYTVVVGKLNPAKLANFAEVDGWVVIGCWESSLVEEDAGFYRPVVTPFELEVALMRDEERLWGDRWWGGIEEVSAMPLRSSLGSAASSPPPPDTDQPLETQQTGVDDEESEPPEFDLRTGRLISHSRPMVPVLSSNPVAGISSAGQSLALRPKSEIATINGIVSPGAEYLRSQRTWQGLGSDFGSRQGTALVEEGRAGIARGYTVGNGTERA